MTKITHLTSAHPRYDTRIFIKMCCSLAKKECYDVSLVVADAQGDEVKSGVRIFDVGKKSGRIRRILGTTKEVFLKAKSLESDIYHLHDPELLPVGLKLKKLGKTVIFDAHEDLPKQILGKSYLHPWIRHVLSRLMAMYERYACGKFDAIVTATPYIRDKFSEITNARIVDINNFPIITEFKEDISWREKEDAVCYIGGIARIRGIVEIVKALEYTDNIKLLLAGKFSEIETETEVKACAGWQHVEELGFLGRKEVAEVLHRSKAGLVTLHPIVNYQDALPVKMFEYMAAGVPVISSDITLWRRIVEESSCGLCVDPLDPKAIAEAINYIVSHPQEAEQMGRNGQKAVLTKYNWGIEEQKLYKLYEGLLS